VGGWIHFFLFPIEFDGLDTFFVFPMEFDGLSSGIVAVAGLSSRHYRCDLKSVICKLAVS
jgi:hypothetical protein